MHDEKFYVLDVKNNSYKVFNTYYSLLCFVRQNPYHSFGNSTKDVRWQQERKSIWTRYENLFAPLVFTNVLFIAYDVYMNVISCKKLEKDVLKRSTFAPKYNSKGWKYDFLRKNPNYLGFRNGPVPCTGKRNKYHCFRHIKTTQEKRISLGYIEYTRGKRRNLPSSWEDIYRSDIQDKCSWKKQKKARQWM